MRVRVPMVLGIVMMLAAAALTGLTPATPTTALAAGPAQKGDGKAAWLGSQPDIIVILTDDQRAGTEQAMPFTWSFFRSHGVHYPQAQVPTNLCCPARASFLTGEYAHTTGVWENNGKNGGFKAFRNWQGQTLPANLDDVGYETSLFGKYINRFNRSGGRYTIPKGWDVFHTYDDEKADGGYWTSIAELPEGYTTDVLGDAVVQQIQTADPETPQFIYYSPYAPHAPFDPGPYRHTASREKLLEFREAGGLTEANEAIREKDVQDKPRWIRVLPRLSPRVLRLTADRSSRTLMGVDANVQRIIEAQGQYRDLSNTMVVYLTDNGVAWGDHRLRLKRHPYDQASRIPLLIKYPEGTIGAEPPGTSSTRMVNQLDVTATLAQLGGASPTGEGMSLLGAPRRKLPLEASPSRGGQLIRPGFCGVRTSRFLYLKYTDGTRELYDYRKDPYELENVAGSGRYSWRTVRFDSLLDPGCDLAELNAMPARGGSGD